MKKTIKQIIGVFMLSQLTVVVATVAMSLDNEYSSYHSFFEIVGIAEIVVFGCLAFLALAIFIMKIFEL